MNPIGIMQGRLSPPIPGRLQAFPWNSWEQEFDHAGAIGLDTIEWLFESDRYEQNPIWGDAGLAKIRSRIASTGVQVRSLCADYFMSHPFFRVSEAERRESIAVLNKLITCSAEVGIRVILLPVLEQSEIRTPEEKVQLLDSLQHSLELAAEHDIRLGLETELAAAEYRELVEGAKHAALGAYYDTGNAAAKGFEISADVHTLKPLLCGMHIKDRTRNGPSVLLGQGSVNFPRFSDAISQANYNNPFILQTAFDEEYLTTAAANLQFIEDHLSRAKHRLLCRRRQRDDFVVQE